MKFAKTTLKIVAALMCIALVFGIAMALSAFSASAQELEDAQNDTFNLTAPDIPNVTAPQPDTSSFDVDMEALYAEYPESIELGYSDGVISIKDIGPQRSVKESANTKLLISHLKKTTRDGELVT